MKITTQISRNWQRKLLELKLSMAIVKNFNRKEFTLGNNTISISYSYVQNDPASSYYEVKAMTVERVGKNIYRKNIRTYKVPERVYHGLQDEILINNVDSLLINYYVDDEVFYVNGNNKFIGNFLPEEMLSSGRSI